MASGAGQNRVNQAILVCTPAATALATPLTGYGTINGNDSGQVMNEAANFTKWTFQMTGGGTGYSVTIYGTADRLIYRAWMNSLNPGQPTFNAPSQPVINTAALASSWFPLYAQSDQSGTGAPANPMTATSPSMQFSGELVAVRAVLTTTTGAAGSVTIVASAVP